MTASALTNPLALPTRGPRRLPASRMPLAREDRKRSALASLLLHAFIVLMVLGPVIAHDQLQIIERDQRTAGAGPAGGGGGGRRGTGGVQVRVDYISAAAPTPTPVQAPPVTPPPPVVEEVKPVVPPVVTKPIEELKIPEVATASVAPPAQIPSVVVGSGGGSGTDGSRGDGPGKGGGVGSGDGPGRGSGVGPGTGGGGTLNYYPPSPVEVYLLPLPKPAKVRGTKVTVEFDVDETGKVVGDPAFTKTKDGDYNKKLKDIFAQFRFRPATTFDGKPIRVKTTISFDL